MSSDQNDQPDSPTPEQSGVQPPTEPPARRQILIGSQRDPDAYRPKPKRDWQPVAKATQPPDAEPGPPPAVESPAAEQAAVVEEPPEPVVETIAETIEEHLAELTGSKELAEQIELFAPSPGKKLPPPNIRAELPPELEAELEDAMNGVELDELMDGGESVTQDAALERGEKYTARVVAVRRDDVFLELGGREQGILPVKQMEEVPEVGSQLEVRVVRFNNEDGLYELSLPHVAADVADWSDIEEGMLVDARITGHNTGGLECDVNHIRGFIPAGQVALYHVDDMEQFKGEKLTCLVTEANPSRRNLVLSRRAVLERQKEEARKELLETLAPGQVLDGVVRKLMDFGAFVDIGGVDGLLHISQLSWARVDHPRDVLQEGQTIKVRVDKVDPVTGRISLAYRDMMESPWTGAAMKYPPTTAVTGKVTKLMEFGAFVELEPGVEGLVHISELSHKRVWRVSDVVSDGAEVEVVVLSIDADAQRISLSMKDALPEPESAVKKESDDDFEPAPASKNAANLPQKPLRGGVGRSTGGEQFGLKW